MKPFFFGVLLLAMVFLGHSTASAATTSTSLGERLAGRILLDVEQNGEAWYVSTSTGSRYYLGRPTDAFRLMRLLGLGISDADLARVPIEGSAEEGDAALRERLSGRIVLQVEQNGEAWYIDPVSLQRSYLGRPSDAFDIMVAKGLGISSANLERVRPSPPPDFLVAFLGDQSVTQNSRAVLDLVRSEGADLVVHMGDLGYETNGASAWNDMINEKLGTTFPYVVSIGNHDVAEWSTYEALLEERAARTPGLFCEGELGVNETCQYQGVLIVNSGIGTYGSDHLASLQTGLASQDVDWKICNWHKNQRLMQVGGKSDETGWEVYDACREAGAIVATGHEHSYSRTYLMSDFATQTLEHTLSSLTLEPGRTFAFVQGLAGHSIRDEEDNLGSNPWWASTYTSDNGANYGALFCRLHENGDEQSGTCYFKDIDRTVPDAFTVRSGLR
ncbi:MAG: metallophosphoesterase [Candidatus Doudnabacteria bacterium]|nr:metallophosphoesterase [Candidatus Doudnabacteria bacterium]